MQIIPAVNCPDFGCIKDKLQKMAEFLPAGGWAQLDIADGKFTQYKTWNNPEELRELRIKNYELKKLNLEIHLMLKGPEEVVNGWVEAGAKRIIVHLEAINAREFSRIWPPISHLAEVGLAINPETPAQQIAHFIMGSISQSKEVGLPKIRFVQILAVSPGSSGQNFQPIVLGKIKFLKKNYPDVIIEVDGGINLETAKLCKEAGADILVAGSYVFDDPNADEAYNRLASI